MEIMRDLEGIDKKKLGKYISYLYNLGSAMRAYYNCEELSLDQIELIANATSEDKIRGMNLVSDHVLVNDKNYVTYYKNSTAIKLSKKRRG